MAPGMTFLNAVAILAFTGIYLVSGAVPQKANKGVVKRKAAAVASVPRQRVLKEFAAAYRAPAGTSTVRLYHAGAVRNYTIEQDAKKIPAQSQRVAQIVRIDDCGINTKDIWEVAFYRLETEWIFRDIRQISTTQMTKTKKKHPPIEDEEAKRLIADALVRAHAGLTVNGITIQDKKSTWRLCVPEYSVKTRIGLSVHDEIRNTVNEYECLFVSTLAHLNGTWEHRNTSCIYRGKEMADCHIGTMCRGLSTGNTIPAPTESESENVMKDALAASHAFKQRRAVIESFSLIRILEPENFGRTVPCVALARFVIDENRESIAGGGGVRRSYVPVRAVYECLVQGRMVYSAQDKKWEGMIESCCSPGGEDCREQCSGMFKGCHRLGEK